MSQFKSDDESNASETAAANDVEAALRASEERYRSIIESAVNGILVIDCQGRIEAFNAAAERLFGYAAGEVPGRNVNVLMPEPYHTEPPSMPSPGRG